MTFEPIYRARPALVRQRYPMSCWAAALESWLSVCSPRCPFDEAWALATFAPWQTPDHRLEWAGLEVLRQVFSMDHDETGPGGLTPEYLAARLRRGHLYVTYMPTPGPVASHTVVIYGVGNVAADVMDPLEGYLSRPHEFFRARTRALVFWPSLGDGTIPDPSARLRLMVRRLGIAPPGT